MKRARDEAGAGPRPGFVSCLLVCAGQREVAAATLFESREPFESAVEQTPGFARARAR